jgi:flap endonuclease-1
MGVKQLNKLIRLHTDLSTIRICDLSGKTIAIDIMIYMYKYLATNSLLENMYSLCILCMHNNITPLFIFDGEKPKEKTDELNRRRENRRKAWEKYDNILNNLKEDELNSFHVKKELSKLKRQCVKVKHTHIEDVKNLINYFGMTYIVADGEADKLCAEMVIHKKAYACMSDDMDLFMYGCPVVLRLFNVQKKH